MKASELAYFGVVKENALTRVSDSRYLSSESPVNWFMKRALFQMRDPPKHYTPSTLHRPKVRF